MSRHVEKNRVVETGVTHPPDITNSSEPEPSWDEAESVMRQLEKELQVAKGAHAALRKAREANEATTKAEQEHARLTAEIETLRETLSQEHEAARIDRAALGDELAMRKAGHAQFVEAMRAEVADLQAQVALARQTAKDADLNMSREHVEAVALRRQQIDALGQEKSRIESDIKRLQASVAGIV